jgi:ABC-type branched-subunit amino acid transport system substrate-binding protein
MKNKICLAPALVLSSLALLAAGCGSDGDDSSAETFRLGVEAPLSGEQAVLGKGMLRGAELAANELN